MPSLSSRKIVLSDSHFLWVYSLTNIALGAGEVEVCSVFVLKAFPGIEHNTVGENPVWIKGSSWKYKVKQESSKSRTYQSPRIP